MAICIVLLACSVVSSAQAQPPSFRDARYEQAVRELLASPAGVAFLDAYIAVGRDYLYGVDRDALFEGAIEGLVSSLDDPYTTYLDPVAAEAARRIDDVGSVEIAQVGDFGLIRVGSFEGDATGARFGTGLDTLLDVGVRGIILDLRGNEGGSILQGLQVLDRFLAEGELGYRRVRGVSVPIAYANPRATAQPVVVLVDASTASTAEIVAGTLQAYGRGRLIGTRTAGKGVGQSAIRLADGSELRLVTFEWLLPGRRSVDGVGLMPDIVLSAAPVDPVSSGEPRPFLSVAEEGGDPFLRVGIEALRGLLGDDLPLGSTVPVPFVTVGVTIAPAPRPAAERDELDEGATNDENGASPTTPPNPRP